MFQIQVQSMCYHHVHVRVEETRKENMGRKGRKEKENRNVVWVGRTDLCYIFETEAEGT